MTKQHSTREAQYTMRRFFELCQGNTSEKWDLQTIGSESMETWYKALYFTVCVFETESRARGVNDANMPFNVKQTPQENANNGVTVSHTQSTPVWNWNQAATYTAFLFSLTIYNLLFANLKNPTQCYRYLLWYFFQVYTEFCAALFSTTHKTGRPGLIFVFGDLYIISQFWQLLNQEMKAIDSIIIIQIVTEKRIEGRMVKRF